MRPRRSAGDGVVAARRALRGILSPSSAPVWIAAVVVVALAIGFIALGGLRPATRAAAAETAGTEVRTSLYAVTVTKAELVDAVEEHYWEADEGQTLVLLTARLENLSDRPVALLGTVDSVSSQLVDSNAPLLRLADVTPSKAARAWHADGTVRTPVLQPGVPAEVVIGWSVPEDSFPDGTVRLDVYDARERAGQIILASSSITWRRTHRIAQITVELAR